MGRAESNAHKYAILREKIVNQKKNAKTWDGNHGIRKIFQAWYTKARMEAQITIIKDMHSDIQKADAHYNGKMQKHFCFNMWKQICAEEFVKAITIAQKAEARHNLKMQKRFYFDLWKQSRDVAGYRTPPTI